MRDFLGAINELSGRVGHIMRIPDTIIDYVEAEVAQCRTVVDVEEMTKSLASRFPGIDYDRDEVTAIIVDRAGARGLAVRFATT